MAEAQQPQSAEAQCAAGEAAFLAHDYRTARALLTAAAEAGCARAMACLGLLLRDCYGVGDDSITTEATELLSSLTPTQVAAVMPPSPRGLATSRSAIPSRTASNGSSSSSSSASASSSIAGVLTARSSSPRLGAAPPVRIAKLSIASLMARQPLLSGSGDGAVMRSSTATSSASESALDDEDDDANGVTAHANGVAGAGAGVGAGLEFAFDGAASPLSSTRTTPTPRAASSPTPTPPPAAAAAVTTATATMTHAHQQAPPGLPTASTTTSSSSLLHRPQLRSIAGMVVAASEHHVGLRASYGVLDSSFDDEELHLSNGSNGDMSMLMAVDQPNNEQQQQHQKHHQQAGAAVLDAMSIAPSRDATLQHLNGHHDANSREATAALESLSLDWQPVEHESVRWLERGMALGCPLSQHQLAVALRKGWGTVRDKQRAQNLITDAVTRVLQLAAINESAIARARQQSHKEEQECCNDKDNDKDDDDDDDDEEEADHDGEQQHGIDGTRAESAPTASIELDWLLQYLKAFSYRVGFGCATDLPEARRIFLALAKRGIAVAQKHLAKMWLKGLGGPKNALKAVKWMSRAAEQGHRAAQYDLAVMSERGQGCERDAARHYALLEQAAKQGHGNALYACARRFKRACSDADPSFSLAKRLYTLASRAGNEHAQYNLALMFKRGEGGEVNLTKARQLFELAAANGYPRARVRERTRDEIRCAPWQCNADRMCSCLVQSCQDAREWRRWRARCRDCSSVVPEGSAQRPCRLQVQPRSHVLEGSRRHAKPRRGAAVIQ